jgi:hypothetical protein
MCGFCNVWVCVNFVMCGCVCMCKDFVLCECFDNIYIDCTLTEVFLNLTEVYLTMTEVFFCFILRCKANARIKLSKTGHGPHSSKLVVICVFMLISVLFYVLFLCKCLLYYCHRVTTQLQLINILYHIRIYKIFDPNFCYIRIC